jgi:hypothetical protein
MSTENNVMSLEEILESFVDEYGSAAKAEKKNIVKQAVKHARKEMKEQAPAKLKHVDSFSPLLWCSY